LNHKYGVQADRVYNSMKNHCMHEKEKPILDSNVNIKLNNETENRSENDRRRDFDRRSKVGRRRSSDRRYRKSHKYGSSQIFSPPYVESIRGKVPLVKHLKLYQLWDLKAYHPMGTFGVSLFG
jgi:hypothetical protein